MSVTLAPGKQKVAADFLLMFLTIESPIIRVVGGGVNGGQNFIRDDGGDGEGWTERGAGALLSAGVNCGVERRALTRQEHSGLGDRR